MTLLTRLPSQCAPYVAGTFPVPAAVPESVDADFPAHGMSRVWPELSSLWSWGRWRSGELRGVTYRGAGLVTVGQCFADDRQLRAGLVQAVESDRWEALTRWPGSYLVIMARDDELLAFTDLAGQFPLYYCPVPGRVAFGSRPAIAAAAAGIPARPDRVTVAAQILCPTADPLFGERSVLHGVHRLGGGQALRIDAAGRSETWTYDPLIPDRHASLADGAEALRVALTAAVGARVDLGERLTADFSGGLDSTSIAFLAAHRTPTPLPVFVYHHPDAPAGDLEHAERFARLDGRLELTVLPGSRQTLTYHGLDQVRPAGQPEAAAVNSARLRVRLAGIAAGAARSTSVARAATPSSYRPPAIWRTSHVRADRAPSGGTAAMWRKPAAKRPRRWPPVRCACHEPHRPERCDGWPTAWNVRRRESRSGWTPSPGGRTRDPRPAG